MDFEFAVLYRYTAEWLEDYLVAKRAVETKLSYMTAAGKLRGSCLRPSLVYTFDRPQALPAVVGRCKLNSVDP